MRPTSSPIPTQVTLTRELSAELRDLATLRGESVSELVEHVLWDSLHWRKLISEGAYYSRPLRRAPGRPKTKV